MAGRGYGHSPAFMHACVVVLLLLEAYIYIWMVKDGRPKLTLHIAFFLDRNKVCICPATFGITLKKSDHA